MADLVSGARVGELLAGGDNKEAHIAIYELQDEIRAANGMDRMHLLAETENKALVQLQQVRALQQPRGSYDYDVFLSFRGEDTRESFTSTLFYSLSEVGKVKTFMDVNFKKGSKLVELLKIIEKSRMSIVVFSENFAESEWCLKELAKIFEERDQKGHEVVPVFYKVDPSELRHQNTGKTKEHMEKHHNKYGRDSDIVKSWSNAIKELGNSSGYTYWSGRGKQEVELAKEIAHDIWTRVPDDEQAHPSELSQIINLASILCRIIFLGFFGFFFLSILIVLMRKFPWCMVFTLGDIDEGCMFTKDSIVGEDSLFAEGVARKAVWSWHT